MLWFVTFKNCSDTAFGPKGGGVGVFVLFLLEQQPLSCTVNMPSPMCHLRQRQGRMK